MMAGRRRPPLARVSRRRAARRRLGVSGVLGAGVPMASAPARTLLAAVVAAALLSGGCGGEGDGADEAAAPSATPTGTGSPTSAPTGHEAVVERWLRDGALGENTDEDEQAVRTGAELVAESGRLNCHQYRGVGSPNLGAPDLTQIGAQGRGVDYFQRYVTNPREFGNSVMPQYQSLGAESLRAIAVFLDASRNP